VAVRLVGIGSFAEALRAAIQARGLGLERIQERLAREGISVSVATLSYWQNGRSRPERHGSLRALGCLEGVLELPRGTLVGLLPPPRTRGRWLKAADDGHAMSAFWPQAEQVTDLLDGVDTRWDDRLARISQHDRVTVGADRGERSFLSRQVLRAEADGPDRWVVIMHLDENDRPAPRVRALRNCRAGRVVARPEIGFLAAELLFERPLRRGETVITEHELVNSGPFPLSTNYERKFRFPVREYVLEVGFDPGEKPVRCTRYSRPDGEPEKSAAVPMDEVSEVHAVALGFGPGCYGFRWEWET
jgi:hypothetical protein